MSNPLIVWEPSDLPGDAVSLAMANRLATDNYHAGIRTGLTLGWLTAAVVAVAWWCFQ